MRTIHPILENALANNIGNAVIKCSIKNSTSTVTPTILSYELNNLEAKIVIAPEYINLIANQTIFRIERGLSIDGTEYLINSSWYVLKTAKVEAQSTTITGHVFKASSYSAPGDVIFISIIADLIESTYTPGIGYVNEFANPEHTPWWNDIQFYPNGRTLALSNIRGIEGLLKQKYIAQLIDLGENQISVIDNGTINQFDPTINNFITSLVSTTQSIVGLAQRDFYYRDENNTVHHIGSTDAQPHNLGFIPSGTTIYPLLGGSNSSACTIAPPDLRIQNGDFIEWQYNEVAHGGYMLIREVFNPNQAPSWRMELQPISILNNTEGGAMPSSIEAAAPYTPLATIGFDNFLNSTVNNLQAFADFVDNYAFSSLTLHAGALKATLDNADEFIILDSGTTGWLARRFTWAEMKDDVFSAFGVSVNAASSKTPHNNDMLSLVDSETAGKLVRQLTWANAKTQIYNALGPAVEAATPKTTLVDDDIFLIVDSETSGLLIKPYTLQNLKDQLLAKKTAWTPTFTNLTVGNGTLTCEYAINGDIVKATIHLTFGSTTSISGSVSCTIPIGTITNNTAQPLGILISNDASINQYAGVVTIQTSTSIVFRTFIVSGTNIIQNQLSATIPFTWATGDRLTAIFEYIKS